MGFVIPMFTLLIVDDEQEFRDGLKNNINWSENDITIIGEASNGKEGLELIEHKKPNIIITDIIMPVMDGLTFAETVHDRYPEIKVIMLTVLEGFVETQRSLRAQVVDYILKYKYKEETLPAVQRACRMIEIENKLFFSNSKREYLDNGFLQKCLEPSSPKEMIQSAFDTGFDHFKGKLCTVVALSIDGRRNSFIIRDAYIDLHNVIAKIEAKIQCFIISLGRKDCLVVFFDSMAKSALMKCGQHVINAMKSMKPEYSNIRIGVGGIKDNPLDLSSSLEEAELALTMTDYNKTRYLFYFSISEDANSYHVLMQKAAEYIDEHYSNCSLTLKEVADVFYISPSYFSTLFKKTYGVGFNEYLTNLRLSQVKKMLDTTNMKVYEIAERVGYTSAQYLSIIFKRFYGISPSDYKHKENGGIENE